VHNRLGALFFVVAFLALASLSALDVFLKVFLFSPSHRQLDYFSWNHTSTYDVSLFSRDPFVSLAGETIICERTGF